MWSGVPGQLGGLISVLDSYGHIGGVTRFRERRQSDPLAVARIVNVSARVFNRIEPIATLSLNP